MGFTIDTHRHSFSYAFTSSNDLSKDYDSTNKREKWWAGILGIIVKGYFSQTRTSAYVSAAAHNKI